MKDRVREALFNLLGDDVVEQHVIDLFAGTGALGFEALSRGAARATLIELHFPTAKRIRENADQLGVADRTNVISASAIAWDWRAVGQSDRPWLVFCSPPYEYYVDKSSEMIGLLRGLSEDAPPDSIVVIECDRRFDRDLLPRSGEWQFREYPPAVLGIFRKTASH